MKSTDRKAGRDSTREGETHSSDALRQRIRELEAELAKARARGYHDELRTVKVPEPFEPPFLIAQQYVSRYFAERLEQPETATISIAGERYVLLRAAALSVEFVDQVTSMYQDKGPEEARGVANNLLFDLGHALGKGDARCFQEKMGLQDPIENLSAGPVHFAFSGWAFVDISPQSTPVPNEDYFLLYDHPYSFESHAWVKKGRRSDKPVCVMNAGYSSGWCEESFGLPLVAVEVECIAAGDERCRFIMAPPSRIEQHLERYRGNETPSRNLPSRRPPEIPEFFHRKRLEDELRQANERLEQRVEARTRELEAANRQLRLLGSAVENAAEGIVIMEYLEESSSGEGDLTVTFVNRGFSRITGFEAQSVAGHSLERLPLVAESGQLLRELLAHVRKGQAFKSEMNAVRADGSEYALEMHMMPAEEKATPSRHWIAILRDVSDRKAHLEALRRQALHDSLTGLPNRVLLHDRIEQSIASTRRSGGRFALMFLDLDGFKEINDSFGHYTGDLLLAKVGVRLRGALRSTDTIARLGGDEFAVVVGELQSTNDAERLAAQLLESLRDPFRIEDHNVVVGASIGIVICPEHGSDTTTLMQHADIAMYAAKAGRSGAMVYAPEQEVHSPARIRLVNELRNTIDDQHLQLHYQPQVRLSDGETVRVEALLRWNHPEGGQRLPDEFLPLVDNTELGDRIAHWVIRTAIRDCSGWRRKGHDVGVSVNVTPRNLRQEALPELVAHWLREAELPASQLTIEITESRLLDSAVLSTGILERMRAIGVGIAIDDFGTGYSSLVHVKQLPFTELKIDRGFVRDLLVDEHDAAIVRSIVELGRELGRPVIAEGVEDRDVLERLREIGCEYVQGFHVSVPLEHAALLEWLMMPALTR